MSRGIVIRNLTGAYALECESDKDIIYQLRVDDGATPPVDIGPAPLYEYDPYGPGAVGAGFLGQLRSQEGGTLLADAVVSMEGTRAYETLTIGTPADTETVTIGTTVYLFKATLTGATPYEVKVGGDAEGSLDNLIAAINGTGDGEPQYDGTTPAHEDVVAVKLTAATVRVETKTGGTGGNAIATTTTAAAASWGNATLTGGSGAEGFRVHFDGELLPVSLVTSGRSRSCTFDVFGVRADASAIKIYSGRVMLHSSSTQPYVTP